MSGRSLRRLYRRLSAAALAGALVCAHAQPALAYLKLGLEINGREIPLTWPRTPVRYFVTDSGVAGVGATDLQAALGRAFGKWEDVPTASIAYQFAGYTAALPGDEDGRSTIGFRAVPELDRVLAQTSFLVDDATGELLESDIFFNASFPWSVAPAGERGRYDLETIALHETGHFSGLGHSALGETELISGGRRVLATAAVMFPIAFGTGVISNRTLQPDDIAGISDLYPADGFNDTTGSVSGRVTKNGRGLFGAHIVAFDPATGRLVGNFALNAQGQFSIAGLSPGPRLIRVEPLDDADPGSFFNTGSALDVDFRVTFFDRLVVVPKGGDRSGTDVQVSAK